MGERLPLLPAADRVMIKSTGTPPASRRSRSPRASRSRRSAGRFNHNSVPAKSENFCCVVGWGEGGGSKVAAFGFCGGLAPNFRFYNPSRANRSQQYRSEPSPFPPGAVPRRFLRRWCPAASGVEMVRTRWPASNEHATYCSRSIFFSHFSHRAHVQTFFRIRRRRTGLPLEFPAADPPRSGRPGARGGETKGRWQ